MAGGAGGDEAAAFDPYGLGRRVGLLGFPDQGQGVVPRVVQHLQQRGVGDQQIGGADGERLAVGRGLGGQVGQRGQHVGGGAGRHLDGPAAGPCRQHRALAVQSGGDVGRGGGSARDRDQHSWPSQRNGRIGGEPSRSVPLVSGRVRVLAPASRGLADPSRQAVAPVRSLGGTGSAGSETRVGLSRPGCRPRPLLLRRADRVVGRSGPGGPLRRLYDRQARHVAADVRPEDVLAGISGVSLVAYGLAPEEQAARLLVLLMDGLRYRPAPGEGRSSRRVISRRSGHR